MTDFPLILEIFLGIALLAFMVAIGLLVATAKITLKSDSKENSPDPHDHVQAFMERKGLL